MIKTADRINFVEEYYFSKKLREIANLNKAGKDIINLGIGSPDLAPSDQVIESLKTYAEDPNGHGYQNYKGIPLLREKIAEWYNKYYQVNLDPENEILPLIGSKEGIMHISMTYLQAGDEVLVPDPGYPAYSACANLSGASIIKYKLSEENNWQPNLAELEKRDLNKVKLMWVNYPHMPSGARSTKKLFDQLRSFAEKYNLLICNDNPYSFILNEDPKSIFDTKCSDHVLELNSLSKSHNMAGWRIGMIIGSEYHINNILKFKSNMDSGIFKAMQHAAISALSLDEKWFQELNKVYSERQKKAFELMGLLNCQFSRDQVGMFVWAKIPPQYKQAEELTDKVLEEASVFITPGSIFGDQGNDYVRVSLCADLSLISEAIKRIENWKEKK